MTKPRPRGVTLLETLIGIVLLLLVLAFVAPLFRHARVFSESVGGREQMQGRALACLREVSAQIAEAKLVLWPVPNADGSPRSSEYVVLRSFEEEVVFLFFDRARGRVLRATLRWKPDGPGFLPLEPEALPAPDRVQELVFTLVSGPSGRSHVRVALRTEKDWYFDSVKPWNAML